MTYLVICAIALLASSLTFFSGFGLGTVLLPAFALFFPVEQAIAMTAVVHMLNGLFKLALVGRHADRATVLRFGLPAIAAALLGAWLLQWLTGLAPVYRHAAFGQAVEVTPVKLVVGLLLLVFALFELLPRLRDLTFPAGWMAVGGALSGFFGGLAGMQGALRSAFLVRAGLSKEAFIATGVVTAVLVDVSRLGVYTRSLMHAGQALDYPLLTAAIVSAFMGAFVGNRFLKQLTMPGLQRLVAASLFLAALGLIGGVL
jgi:uncharacterized membrane protein YfcA